MEVISTVGVTVTTGMFSILIHEATISRNASNNNVLIFTRLLFSFFNRMILSLD